MKVIPNRTLYRCEYCTKHRLTKAAAVRHELFCRHNPENKHKCFGCEYLVHTTSTKAIGTNGEVQRGGNQFFTCAKKQVEMYTYVAERRKMLDKLGDVERMPLTCDLYAPEQFFLNTTHPENTPF